MPTMPYVPIPLKDDIFSRRSIEMEKEHRGFICIPISPQCFIKLD